MSRDDIESRIEREVLFGRTAVGGALFGVAIGMAMASETATASKLLKISSAVMGVGERTP